MWRPGACLHVAIQSCCIATRAGKWAVAYPASSPALLFFIFLFLFVPPSVKTQILFLFFHIFQQNLRNLFISLYFFSYFTYCKTNRKIFLNIFFYSSSSLPATSNYNPFSCAKTRIIFQNSKKHNCSCSKTGATIKNYYYFLFPHLILNYLAQNSSNKP